MALQKAAKELLACSTSVRPGNPMRAECQRVERMYHADLLSHDWTGYALASEGESFE